MAKNVEFGDGSDWNKIIKKAIYTSNLNERMGYSNSNAKKDFIQLR